MTRQVKYNHNKVVTAGQDATKEVSQDEWNDGHNELGMDGHGSVTTLTVATGAIIPIHDMHKIDGEGAAADDLTTITNTETSEFDEVWLLGGSQTITVKNSGNIVTLSGSDLILSTTVATKFIRISTNWYQSIGTGVGDVILAATQTFTGAKTFNDSTLLLNNPADTFAYTILGSAITAARILTLPLIAATDTFAVLGTAQSFTATQTFQDDSIQISNPADTFQYTITAAAIAADRVLNLPLITGNDTLVVLSLAQTLTNKTLTTPAISSFTNATHDHADAAGGGLLTTLGTIATGIWNGTTIAVANGGTGVTTSTGTGAVVLGTAPTIDSASLSYAINAQTGTTYTPVLLDAGKVVTSSNAAAITLTIPPNSSVAYPIGSSITIISIGVGLTTFAQGSGVTINSTGATSTAPIIRAQFSSATAIKTATNTWVVVGDIS